MAWAGETFASTFSAKQAAEAFKSGAKTARYDIYQDSGNYWRWRAWRSSDKVASSGESFSSKSAAERAAENVRDNARDCERTMMTLGSVASLPCKPTLDRRRAERRTASDRAWSLPQR